MIRARAMGTDGRHVLVLGLSRGNVERLLDGQPIRVTGESVGIPDLASVLIVFGETEAVLEAEMRNAGLISDETVIRRST